MADVKFSPEAIKDLKQTKKYIAEDLCNEIAAENTISKILNDIQILSVFPASGSPLSSIVNIETDYRFLVCGNYTAFYRFEQDTVFISRILYARRDFMRILFGELDEKE